jgi:ribonuclease P protein component
MAQGRGRRADVLSLKMLATQGPFACAVVVSKKVAKSAVKRNSLRRSVYRALAVSPLPPTGHAILFVLSSPKGAAFSAFSSDIKKLLHV